MTLGLIGRKVGMTRIFTDAGDAIAVTVVDVADNRITQIKKPSIDGYSALQVTHGTRRASRVTKPLAGHLAKAGTEAGSITHEFRIPADQLDQFQAGTKLGIGMFEVGQKVDVTGTTVGKGFAGSIKRHHFSSNRASHGNSVSHRSPGSISMAQDPGRVFPGKRMAGHLGAAQRTTLNLEIVKIDVERQLLLVRGAVAGHEGAAVVVRPAIKAKLKRAA